MFEFIKGELAVSRPGYVVIDNHGIGYRVYITLSAETQLPELGETFKLLLYPAYREDDLTLYGFSDEEERALFVKLIAVSGIGPKAAMGILSFFNANEVIKHILKEDVKAISKAPGIGKKTAERLVVELKDKYKGYVLETEEVNKGAIESLRQTDQIFNEAVNGLMGLGYAYGDAYALVEQVIQEDMTIEEILQQALIIA